jgi:hypothetical protein
VRTALYGSQACSRAIPWPTRVRWSVHIPRPYIKVGAEKPLVPAFALTGFERARLAPLLRRTAGLASAFFRKMPGADSDTIQQLKSQVRLTGLSGLPGVLYDLLKSAVSRGLRQTLVGSPLSVQTIVASASDSRQYHMWYHFHLFEAPSAVILHR